MRCGHQRGSGRVLNQVKKAWRWLVNSGPALRPMRLASTRAFIKWRMRCEAGREPQLHNACFVLDERMGRWQLLTPLRLEMPRLFLGHIRSFGFSGTRGLVCARQLWLFAKASSDVISSLIPLVRRAMYDDCTTPSWLRPSKHGHDSQGMAHQYRRSIWRCALHLTTSRSPDWVSKCITGYLHLKLSH